MVQVEVYYKRHLFKSLKDQEIETTKKKELNSIDQEIGKIFFMAYYRKIYLKTYF